MSLENAPLPSQARPRERLVVVLSIRHAEELDHEVAKTLLEEGRRRGWYVLDINLTGGILPDDQPPSGAIVTWLPTDPIPVQLQSLKVPTVRFGKLEHPDDGIIPAVYPDHAATGRMVADYFAQRGFRHLACLTHAQNRVMLATLQAMKARAVELGCTPHLHSFQRPDYDQPILHATSERYAQRVRDINAWLLALPKPVAVLTDSDPMAAQLCILCQRAGLAVPEKVAILGRGNQEVWCEMAPLPISSIDTNRSEHLRTAVQLLDDMMHDKPRPPARTLIAPAGIVTRRSTDILAVADPAVASAIRFIWDHLDQDICVDDVAREMNTPRYKLERAFRKHMGRGINAELVRIRMERCCEMLRSTSSTIAELAPRLGFKTPEYLHICFRKTYGLSPRKYRLSAKKQNPYAPLPPPLNRATGPDAS